MKELNQAQAVDTIAEEGFDTLTTINQVEAFSLAQVDEDGDLHNVIIGQEQAATLIKLLVEFVG